MDFIIKVRSNNENTLHQGWEVDQRWQEKVALAIPAYKTQNHNDRLKNLENSAEVPLEKKQKSKSRDSSKLIREEPRQP